MHIVTLQPKLFLDEHDMSGNVNAFSVEMRQNNPVDTMFGDLMTQRLPGMQSMAFSYAGAIDTADVDGTDKIISDRMGFKDKPLLWCPTGGADGEVCEFGQIVQGEYAPDLKMGAVFVYTLRGELSSVRWVPSGRIARPLTAFSSTWTGSAVQLGALSSTQYLYAQFHCTAFGGTTFQVKIQSDDNAGFTTPTDRGTELTFTAKGAQLFVPITGPITDTYWRIICHGILDSPFTGIGAFGIARGVWN